MPTDYAYGFRTTLENKHYCPTQYSPIAFSNRSTLYSLWGTNWIINCRLILVHMPWSWLSLESLIPRHCSERSTASDVARDRVFMCVILFSDVGIILHPSLPTCINILLLSDGQTDEAGSLWKDNTVSDIEENWKEKFCY